MAARRTWTTSEGRATREAIVNAAMQTFGTRGYRAVSLDAVAAIVGVTRQGVLRHFPSKPKLLIAVLERRDQDDFVRVTEIFKRHGGSLIDTLRAIRADMTPQARSLARLYAMLSAEAIDPDHPAHDHFVERYRRARPGIASWIANAQTNGQVRRDIDADVLATVFLAVLDGLQLQDQLEEDAIDIGQVLTQLLPIFLADPQMPIMPSDAEEP